MHNVARIVLVSLPASIDLIIMKVYFAGSIRGGREDAGRYYEIINHLKKTSSN